MKEGVGIYNIQPEIIEGYEAIYNIKLILNKDIVRKLRGQEISILNGNDKVIYKVPDIVDGQLTILLSSIIGTMHTKYIN